MAARQANLAVCSLQGLVEDPPLYPDHLLHEMIRTALQPAPENVGFGDGSGFRGFDDDGYADEDPADWQRGSLDVGDEFGVDDGATQFQREWAALNGQDMGGGSPAPLQGQAGGAPGDYPEWPETDGFREQQLSFDSNR